MTPCLTEEASNEEIPNDWVGRGIYAVKVLGPTTVLSAILIWQGIKITNEMRVQADKNTERLIGLTGEVAAGLANSTKAIEAQTQLNREKQRSTEKLADAIEDLQKCVEDSKRQ